MIRSANLVDAKASNEYFESTSPLMKNRKQVPKGSLSARSSCDNIANFNGLGNNSTDLRLTSAISPNQHSTSPTIIDSYQNTSSQYKLNSPSPSKPNKHNRMLINDGLDGSSASKLIQGTKTNSTTASGKDELTSSKTIDSPVLF